MASDRRCPLRATNGVSCRISTGRSASVTVRSNRPTDAIADFEAGYDRIVELLESLTPEQILEPGHFAWTGKNALRTYLGANTASHYRFALKIIRRWTRADRNPGAPSYASVRAEDL